MVDPLPAMCGRYGCPGVVMPEAVSKGHAFCSVLCSYLDVGTGRLLDRIRDAESGSRSERDAQQELELLGPLYLAANEYFEQHTQNRPRRRHARATARAGQQESD